MPETPNVVQISCHDLGQHVGCYGVETVQTPNLDRLAAAGVRFEESFCVAPQCSPARAAIATGRYPHQNGVMGLCHSNFAWDLDEAEVHVAERLSAAGYETALAGFQHECRDPAERFDEVVSTAGHCDEVAADATSWLTGGETPFYLQVGFVEPHRKPGSPGGFAPLPDEFGEGTVPDYILDDTGAREEFAAFEGAIERMDAAVGEVLDALDEAGLAAETVVVFTTDHGIPFPRAKCSVYDPGLETALLMRGPGLPEGAVSETTVRSVDHLPTLFDLLDLDIETGDAPTVAGRSVLPELDEAADAPVFAEMTYHDYPDPRRALRTEGYKLIVNFANAFFFMDPSQTWRRRTVTTDPPEPALAYHDTVELYDLREDPGETENLADDPDHAAERAALLERLHGWMVDTDDPLLSGIPTPPIYDRALAALESGETPPDPADW
jgi:arylsulfatase A-like enzyme